MHRVRLTLLLPLALTLLACTTAPVTPVESAAPYLESKAQRLDDLRYVGAQPGANDFKALKAAGITKVINFRTPPEMEELGFDEPKILQELGIEYINIPMGGDDYGYTSNQISALKDALRPGEKVLLHCTIGWRASVVTVAYLVQEEGLPLDEAMVHAQHWWPLQLEKMLGRELELKFAD
ncbi:MAG: hypothetical protein AB8G16_15090 [Gammaproteobacteria bacterium]